VGAALAAVLYRSFMAKHAATSEKPVTATPDTGLGQA
jgi:hypothetical protein